MKPINKKSNNDGDNNTRLKMRQPTMRADETIKVSEWESWLNQPCPKCGENVLTDEDYRNTKVVNAIFETLRNVSPIQMAALKVNVGIETIKAAPIFANTEGLELLEKNDTVAVEIGTHKDISIRLVAY